jgi:hypothetical protein
VNQPIGDARRVVFVRSDLADVAAVAHSRRATVNDVLLAAVAGGYRDLLLHRGEAAEGLVLRASVPVSLHAEEETVRANHDGMIFAPLPVGMADPTERLVAIAAATAELKRHVHRPPSGPLVDNRFAQRAVWRRFDRQRWSNAYLANVPGPPIALHLAGLRLEEVFPIVPIIGNLTIGVGALSYAGQFNITVVADGACTDVDVFAAGLRSTLLALGSVRTAPRP